jgi:hypothetical protein
MVKFRRKVIETCNYFNKQEFFLEEQIDFDFYHSVLLKKKNSKK